MSDRRKQPANKWGCKPTEDVCVQHDDALICRHGCEEAKRHECGHPRTFKGKVVEPVGGGS